MPFVTVSFPIKLVRQFAEPIDVDSFFDTTAARLSYLTSPRRYAGIVCFDNQDGSLYFLNKAKNAWIPIGGSSGALLVTLTTDGTYVLPAGNIIDLIIITPTVDSPVLKVGTTVGGEEIMPSNSILATVDYPLSEIIIARTDKTIYFSGITASTAILIYRRSLTNT